MRFISLKSTLIFLKRIFFILTLIVPISGHTESEKLDFLATVERLCQEKDYSACYVLSGIYYYGIDVFKSELFDGLVKSHGQTLKEINELDVSNFKQDKIKAKLYSTIACDGGYIDSCLELGRMYLLGDGIQQNNLKALDIFEDVCNAGRTTACLYAGMMYYEGYYEGTNFIKDNFKAFEYNQKACLGEEAHGCLNLGLIYLNGEGIRQDNLKAVEAFKKTCKSGEPKGCINLGVMYIKGEGVDKNYKTALELFGKACDLKLDEGCKRFALLNKQGAY